ncbi:hypothetical protein Tco_0893544 [Tanacetum coccineum]|uniref:Uncharacterized protein n=1 Tax=Tanacetum coccineum TaxID=301880 RepID=A0ABQ5CBX1_9ASTR
MGEWTLYLVFSCFCIIAASYVLKKGLEDPTGVGKKPVENNSQAEVEIDSTTKKETSLTIKSHPYFTLTLNHKRITKAGLVLRLFSKVAKFHCPYLDQWVAGGIERPSTISSILCNHFEGAHDLFEKEKEEGQEVSKQLLCGDCIEFMMFTGACLQFVLIDHRSNEAKRSRDHFVTKGLRNTSFQNYVVEVADYDRVSHLCEQWFLEDGFATTVTMRKMDLLLLLLDQNLLGANYPISVDTASHPFSTLNDVRAALQLEISCLYSEGGNSANDAHIQRNNLPYDLRRGESHLVRGEMEADAATCSRVYDVHIDHGPKSSDKLNEAKNLK